MLVVGEIIIIRTMSDTNDDTNHHYGVLLEDINHKFDAILEGQQSLIPISRDVAQLKTDMREVKTRLTTIEFAVTDLSKQHCKIENRVTKLERTA